MTYYVGTMPVGEHLSHHGIKGMKWGQRRYQNPDGSLTAAGRVRYGVSNAYSRVRSGARNAAGRSKSWYKKNEKQIKRAAKIAGATAAVAGTAYLGTRYGKSAVRAAKRLGRAAPFKARVVGNKARTMYAKGVVNARHAGRNIKTGFGNVTRKVGARASAFKANNKLARSSANAYRKYGVVGSNLRKGDKAFIDAGKAAKRAGSNLASKARKTAIKTGFKANALGYKAKATYAKGIVGAKGAARKAGATAKKAASQAKFDASRKLRAAGYKAKAAKAKAVVGAKGAARKVGSKINKTAKKTSTAKTFNTAPTFFMKNHPASMERAMAADRVRRERSRFIKRSAAAGAVAGGTAAGVGYNYGIKRKKKSRK